MNSPCFIECSLVETGLVEIEFFDNGLLEIEGVLYHIRGPLSTQGLARRHNQTKATSD